MQTQAYVQLCRETTNEIKAHTILPKVNLADRQAIAKQVASVIALNTNPTLPSYQNMVELAKQHNLVGAE